MADNYAKVKSRKYASDDDAENLLAGILDDTEDIAKAEQERIEAELRAKEAREAERRQEEERRKKEAAAAKLSAEMERLEKVEQRRTAKLQALKIEELKERGEWIDPEIERKKLEDKLRQEAEMAAMKQAAEAQARQKHASSAAVGAEAAAMPQAQAKSGLPIYLAVAAALVAALGAAGFVMMTGYELDSAAYSKSVFAPKENAVALVEKGFTPIPKAEPVVAAVEEDSKPATKKRRQTNRRRVASKSNKKPANKLSSKPSQNKANKKAAALEEALNTDIFGGGLE